MTSQEVEPPKPETAPEPAAGIPPAVPLTPPVEPPTETVLPPKNEGQEDQRKGPQRPDTAGRHFPDIRAPEAVTYRTVKLSDWRSDGVRPGTSDQLPVSPGLYFLRAVDIRAIAGRMTQGGGDDDVVLDMAMAGDSNELAKTDGRSLFELLRAHLTRLDAPARVVFNPGTQGAGTEFWEAAIRDAEAASEFCRAMNRIVYVAAIGKAAGAHLDQRKEMNAIAIDPWPLIEKLATLCPKNVSELLNDARQLVAQGQLTPERIVRALDTRDSDAFIEEIEEARKEEPFVGKASEFITRHFIGEEKQPEPEPSDMAIAFTAACFDELTPREFRSVAQDLVETPGLVEPPPPAKPDEPVVPRRTRIDERALLKVGVATRHLGTRGSIMTLRGAQRYHDVLRREIPHRVPFTAAKFVEQMSTCLSHGAVSPDHWEQCCDLLGQVFVAEVGTSAEMLGRHAAEFWLASRTAPGGANRERGRNLADNGELPLRRLCERTAAAAGIAPRRLEVATAAEMVAAARVRNADTAWCAPAAAALAAHVCISAESAQDIEPLLSVCLRAAPEVVTLMAADLTGGFGLAARAEKVGTSSDSALAAFAELSLDDNKRSEPLRRLAGSLAWRLAAIRLSADAKRLETGEASAVSDELSKQLLLFAIASAPDGNTSNLIEPVPSDASWMDTVSFEHLNDGWRNAPEIFDWQIDSRSRLFAGESIYLPTMASFDAITAARLLGDLRPKALEHLAAGYGFDAGASLGAVSLWMPSSDADEDEDDESPPAFPRHVSQTPDDAAVAGLRRVAAALLFEDHMRRLRASIPLLTLAFAHAASTTGPDGRKMETTLGTQIDEVLKDKEKWSILRGHADETRNLLAEISDLWREAVRELAKTDATRAVIAQADVNRGVFRAWWSAVQSRRNELVGR